LKTHTHTHTHTMTICLQEIERDDFSNKLVLFNYTFHAVSADYHTFAPCIQLMKYSE